MFAKMPSPQTMNDFWDRVSGSDFTPATLHPRPVNGLTFHVLYGGPPEPSRLHVYCETHLSLLADPRPRAYQYRWLLIPREDPAGRQRWQMELTHIIDLLQWSLQFEHLITYSTFKAGASHPWSMHAQALPWRVADPKVPSGWRNYTTLAEPEILPHLEALIDFGTAPFGDVCVQRVAGGYPAPGVRITFRSLYPGLIQAARRAFIWMAGYDHFQALNLLILPRQLQAEDGSWLPAIFLFPRRRDGQAVFPLDGQRWQIASLELNGLLQVRSPDQVARLGPAQILDVFARIAPPPEDVRCFFALADTI